MHGIWESLYKDQYKGPHNWECCIVLRVVEYVDHYLFMAYPIQAFNLSARVYIYLSTVLK